MRVCYGFYICEDGSEWLDVLVAMQAEDDGDVSVIVFEDGQVIDDTSRKRFFGNKSNVMHITDDNVGMSAGVSRLCEQALGFGYDRMVLWCEPKIVLGVNWQNLSRQIDANVGISGFVAKGKKNSTLIDTWGLKRVLGLTCRGLIIDLNIFKALDGLDLDFFQYGALYELGLRMIKSGYEAQTIGCYLDNLNENKSNLDYYWMGRFEWLLIVKSDSRFKIVKAAIGVINAFVKALEILMINDMKRLRWYVKGVIDGMRLLYQFPQ
jgi:GT2 family glycosyltransferase